MTSQPLPRTDLSAIDGEDFDVVVVGGGIIGASTAREAAAAGYSVLLVEKNDFASGATSRSSRLLHCGLRYFEAPDPLRTFIMHPGRFLNALRMAREAMVARHEIVTSAPERVNKIDFHLPIYADGPFEPWQIDAAFALLSRLGPRGVPLDYRRLRREAALSNPMVAVLSNHDRLIGAARFTEYQFDWPERLCIDAVMDARALGAVALNYTAARLGETEGDRRRVVLQRDDTVVASVTGRRVMVMAGAWIDRILCAARPGTPRKTLGTKGAHIVLRLADELRGQGIATINSRGEPFYCIPWHEFHYIGPTETVYEGDPELVRADADDVAFLVGEARALFPGLDVTREKVVGTWAGVRPLTYAPHHPKGARVRTLHDLAAQGMPGVFAMTAGPVMTHRASGREVVKRLKQDIEPSRAPASLDYAPHLPMANSNTARVIRDDEDYHLADVERAVREEGARTISDVLYRRLGLGWRHVFSDDELDRVASAMAFHTGWSEGQKSEEIDAFRAETETLFGVPGGKG